MALINLKEFKGKLPRFSSRLLPPSFGQVAKNCDLRAGTIKPYKTISQIQVLPHSGAIRSIYKMGSTWLAWTSVIDIIKSEIYNSDHRVYFTGDSYPKQTTATLAAGATPPAASRRYGVTKPAVTMTINLHGTAGADIADTVTYWYTHVCKWGDGLEEESAPAPITATVDIYDGQWVRLTGMTKPTLGATGNDITHFRFYRSVTGASGGTEMQAIKVSTGSASVPSAALAYDIAAADSLNVWDVDSVASPTGLNQDFGEVCPTEEWEKPSDNMVGLIHAPNGMYAGFYGNQVFISEPLYPYAFPYTKDLPHNVVALALLDQGLCVLTDTYPYIFTGNDPRSMQRDRINERQACVAKRGVAETPDGIIYPTPDGLFGLGYSTRRILTKDIYRRDQWQALTPANLIAFFHNTNYLGFFSGANNGLIFDFTENAYVVDFELPATYQIYGGYHDATGDALYLLTKHTGDGLYYVEQFEGSASSLTATWRSGIIYVSGNGNFACGKIDANYSGGATITFKLYGDDALLDTVTVTSDEVFRLSSTTRAEKYEIEVETSTAEIFKILVATSVEELLRG